MRYLAKLTGGIEVELDLPAGMPMDGPDDLAFVLTHLAEQHHGWLPTIDGGAVNPAHVVLVTYLPAARRRDRAPQQLQSQHVDADGDVWERTARGLYRYASNRMPYLNLTLTLMQVVERFGSWGDPVSEEGNGFQNGGGSVPIVLSEAERNAPRLPAAERMEQLFANLSRELGELRLPGNTRWPRQRGNGADGNAPDPGTPAG